MSILATLSQQSGKIACLPEKKPVPYTGIGEHPDLNDGVRTNIRPLIKANFLHKSSNIKWTKGNGRVPNWDRDEYPWFWSGKVFMRDRVNDVRLTNAATGVVRERACGK
jgi:hypothetical protein